jgi:hypothetical protein
MTNMEIVKSQEYQELLKELDADMSFIPQMDSINTMIDFFKYQSNPNDKISYMEEHEITYEILRHTYFFIELDDLTLIGLYNNQLGREYIVLVERDGSIHFIGDSIINWTNDPRLDFSADKVFEFQTACFYKYNIPTTTWTEQKVKISKTDASEEFNNDEKYQNYLKSDILYDTYTHLRDHRRKNGLNTKKFRVRILGFAKSQGVHAFYIADNSRRTECILDYRFFSHIPHNDIKGFMDIDVIYDYHENGFIDIKSYKTSKVSLFNLVGLFSGFKERMRLITYYVHYVKIFILLFSMAKYIDLKSTLNKFKK